MTPDDFENVIESVDAVVRRHPAGRALRNAEPPEPAKRAPLPDNVVDLRARRIAVRAGSVPDDAA